MLLRSASTPLLNSSSLEPEFQIPRTKQHLTLKATASPQNFSKTHKMSKSASETDIRYPLGSITKPFNGFLKVPSVEEKCDAVGFEGSKMASLHEACEIGFSGFGNGNGNGGGSDRDEGGFLGSGSDGADFYYRKMIEANPRNGLLLGNYARYLKEVRGDLAKAEEYCARAILVNPNDGKVLSMYADLLWEGHKNAARAESYFDQAVKSSPDDCYVLGSYAKFLWDTEEEDDEEMGEDSMRTSAAPSIYHGATLPTIAAAS